MTTDAQIKAMQAGRKRKAEAEARAGVKRVKAYRAWLDAGSPKGKMPEVPSSRDYRAAGNRS